MQCPACTNVVLSITHRQGIEIDFCPSCRGIWLDRGELDKLIERSSVENPQGYAAVDQRGNDPRNDRRNDDDQPRGPFGWLADIFD